MQRTSVADGLLHSFVAFCGLCERARGSGGDLLLGAGIQPPHHQRHCILLQDGTLRLHALQHTLAVCFQANKVTSPPAVKRDYRRLAMTFQF